MVRNKIIDQISLSGNILCFDFVNTIHDRIKDPENDYLSDYESLLQWSVKAGVFNTKTYNISLNAIGSSASLSNKLLKQAIAVRELLYRIFKGISQGEKVDAQDLQAFNVMLSKCLSRQRVKPNKVGFAINWELTPDELLIVTAPIIHSAYELLLSEKLDRVKECPNCGWLFLDTTKNGKRRWCSMKNCGSSVKALEWYHRQKKNE